MKEHKYTCLFVTIVAGILISCGAALAAWNVSEIAVNFLTMSSYKNSIQENYVQPDHVDPGQKVIKEVNIKNEGDVDSFVRVRIDLKFGHQNEKGNFLEEPELDTSLIEVHYNTDLWEFRTDGYWYYKDVLKGGEATKKPLMDSYYLSEKADNRYKNKEARILVNMESIQAESGEMKSIWGIDEKELGIIYQPCTCEQVTSVTFNKDHKLVIGGEDTDLFANFKNLMPGCSRSQTIHLLNESEEEITMFLHADSIKQDKMSSQKKELVRQLLTRYAVIEIKEGNKVLYQGTADGNLAKNGWNMKKDISLGSFTPGKGKNLVVKLTLDEEMDNQYQSLLSKVKWIFSVQMKTTEKNNGQETKKEDDHADNLEYEKDAGEKAVVTVAVSPKTGDTTKIFTKFAALSAAFGCMIFCWKKLYGKKKDGFGKGKRR